jgi:gamma-glutamyltranspeptidase / glutathione hydrolase
MEVSWDQPYSSQRSPVLAENMVASSQPLAVQAGVDILRIGGNAVDAALATAMTLTVVEPTSNGIGGDAFAIVWDGERAHGLNSSGRSPAYWTRHYFQRYQEMPARGWDSVTIPGAVAGWLALSRRFGRLPFEQLFESAIYYARNGFAVSPIIARSWAGAAGTFKDVPAFQQAFMPHGRAPLAGEVFQFEAQAKTLEEIAQSRGESFYRGRLARTICQHANEAGADWRVEDLAAHRAEWVDPLSVDYHGYQVHELPPNGQGLTALIALGILNHCPMDQDVESVQSLHFQLEACKLALELSQRCIADPRFMRLNPVDLLDSVFFKEQAQLLSSQRAQSRTLVPHTEEGTVYLCAADGDGMMVSFIQSNYCGFGSGIVIPETGISLHNRGYGFNLISGHPNEVGPGKKPFHTIIPGFLSRAGRGVMSFGVMGGPMQAQGHVQMMVRILFGRQNPQAASDAPRWYIHHDGLVGFEAGVKAETLNGLAALGHKITAQWPSSRYGGAQLIMKLDRGYCGASDHRKDGQAAGF